MTTIVADTSVIINGNLAQQLESGSIRNSDLIIPQAVFDELQSQASNHKQQGFVGLEQIEKLHKLSEDSGVKILLKGSHPDINDIKFASSGRIDALIIDIAKQNDAILYTSDKVQHLVAKAEDVQTVFLKPKVVFEKLEFLKFFDSTTMSIHLKENQFPLAKRGKPGEFLLTQISDELLTRDYLKIISSQILSATSISDSSNVEISKTGASVIQHDDYRIAITYPPFSESYEITIVHPTVQLSLDDYSISESLMQRLTDRAEGIVISGAPGSGKSTLASG
ncbi:MAG: PIN domain-containing protein, partial [Nitrosopumilus sp.]